MQTSRRAITLSLILGLVGGILPAATVGTAEAARAAKAPCLAGTTPVKGQSAIEFCGPATGVLKVKGKTYDFVHGFCSDDTKNGLELQLSLGTSVPSISNTGNFGQPYLTIAVHKTPFSGGVSAWRNGKSLVVGQSISIAGSAPLKGTFAGKPGTKPTFSGSWNCHGVLYNQSAG
jgi:hypothetical protein